MYNFIAGTVVCWEQFLASFVHSFGWTITP